MSYLKTNKLLTPSQHGLVKNKACVTNLLETMDYLTFSKSKKIPVDILFLDYAKAFDKVAHLRLILKLERYAINGNLFKWLKAYLASRRQRVILRMGICKMYADDTKLSNLLHLKGTLEYKYHQT